ncbi:FecR domain-containing protein [Brevundimonas sp. PAMC22021]|uniref:FecR family protein n=1 Tax=Brevundimonas sp. PAMC22021 TaxID=2861285 RepID=UPI001C633DC3|nr:FecR domain-containing protein [Brevundimonas sp. PAMC22021]QYF85650.1 FecR domain-containing protein [Brevundimonas sp. PAMC22021]
MTKRLTASEVDAEAARWVVQLDRAPLDESRQRALDLWLERDPRHRGALLRAKAAWSVAVGVARPNPVNAQRRHRRWLIGGIGLAAAASGAALLLPPMLESRWYRTAVGEIRRVPLEDGSLAAINTDTAVEVALGRDRRSVRLDRGEAWFQVAKDRSRPFVVATGPVRVRAVGTAFSVRRKPLGAEVRVTEGVVEVWSEEGAGRLRRVSAGEQVFISDKAGAARPIERPLEVERALAWRDGQIVLDGETVGQAAAQFNRYNTRKIVISDPELERQKVIGWFRTNEPESFARALGVSHGAELAMTGEVIMVAGPR